MSAVCPVCAIKRPWVGGREWAVGRDWDLKTRLSPDPDEKMSLSHFPG